MLVLAYICCFWRSNPSSIKELNYHNQQWTLIDILGNKKTYDQANLLFNNELFFLIRFVGEEKTKLLVIFNDQLLDNDLRMICRQLLIPKL